MCHPHCRAPGASRLGAGRRLTASHRSPSAPEQAEAKPRAHGGGRRSASRASAHSGTVAAVGGSRSHVAGVECQSS